MPGVGELFSLNSLRICPRENHIGVDFTGQGPLVPERAIEHCPTPVDDEGNTPQWRNRSAEPSANVVLHTTMNKEVLRSRILERFAAPASRRAGFFPQGSWTGSGESCVTRSVTPPSSQSPQLVDRFPGSSRRGAR